MDDLLDLVNDDLFELSKSFEDEDLLEDLDPADLIQDISCDFGDDHNRQIYSHGSSGLICVKSETEEDDISRYLSSISNIDSSSDTAESKLLKIRKILDTTLGSGIVNAQCQPHPPPLQTIAPTSRPRHSDTHEPRPPIPIDLQPSRQRLFQQQQHKHISPRQPILPAVSLDIIKNPTLASTLIDAQPCSEMSSHSNCDDSSQYSGGGHGGVRKHSHNAIEKRYRLSINDKIDELRAMLFERDDGKMNKSTVLKKAIERITDLEDENNLLRSENYKLKVSLHNLSSNESLHQTGSSPSSNPSSFSNTSSPLDQQPRHLYQQQQQQPPQQLIRETTISRPGQKRPLICNTYINTASNNNGAVRVSHKNEKLARLLLSSGDSPVHHQQQPQRYGDSLGQPVLLRTSTSPIHSSTTSSSSAVPNFLLCTMALFIVSFQPLDLLLTRYRLPAEAVGHPAGRHLLDTSAGLNMQQSPSWYPCLVLLLQWAVAVWLVWLASRHHQKRMKLAWPGRVLCGLSRMLLHHLGRWLLPLKKVCPHLDRQIDHDIERYLQCAIPSPVGLAALLQKHDCQVPSNVVQLLAHYVVLSLTIVAGCCRRRLSRLAPDSEEDGCGHTKLLTLAVEESLLGKTNYSSLQSLWLRLALLCVTQSSHNSHHDNLARFLLVKSLTSKYIRKYVLKRLQLPHLHNSSDQFLTYLKVTTVAKVQQVIQSSPLLDCQGDQRGYRGRQRLLPSYYAAFVCETLTDLAQRQARLCALCPEERELLTQLAENDGSAGLLCQWSLLLLFLDSQHTTVPASPTQVSEVVRSLLTSLPADRILLARSLRLLLRSISRCDGDSGSGLRSDLETVLSLLVDGGSSHDCSLVHLLVVAGLTSPLSWLLAEGDSSVFWLHKTLRLLAQPRLHDLSFLRIARNVLGSQLQLVCGINPTNGGCAALRAHDNQPVTSPAKSARAMERSVTSFGPVTSLLHSSVSPNMRTV